MSRPMTQKQLIAEMSEKYAALEEFLGTLTPEQAVQPGALGEWSVKDVIAHLYEWQQMFFGWYAAGLRGEMPAVPAEGYKWNQLPALNQKIYETHRDRPLQQMCDSLRASHHQTLELVKSLSDETLTTPGLYRWMNKNTLMAYLAANTSSHYHWALAELRKNFRARSGGR